MRGIDARELDPENIALFLDVDGTLIDLAPRPDLVVVPSALISGLASAANRLAGALALISGRPITELDRLFAPLRLRAAGVHGAELRLSLDGAMTCAVAPPLPAELWQDLVRLVDRFPGTFTEDKRASFTVHYPFSDADEQDLAAALARLVARFPQQKIELMKGHKVLEIKRIGVDKGKAIERFMAGVPFTNRVPVFIADDPVVDRTGFEAALALGGMSFSVGAELRGLTGYFPEPEAVRAWLTSLGTERRQ
jgi:trehalose 6-phosphate phosphatase